MTRPRLLLAVTAVVALATTACGGGTADVAADGEGPATGAPAAGACLAGAEDCQDTGGDMGAQPPGDLPVATDAPVAPDEPTTPQATQVEPTDGLRDVHPVAWDEVHVDPDDQTRVTVRWTSGVPPCHTFAEVATAFSEQAVTLTVMEGSVPSDEPQACIEIAQFKQTLVTLDEPIGPRSVVDGAQG